MTRSVYAIATMDTKGAELAYVAACLRGAGVDVRTVDVGTQSPPSVPPDIPRTSIHPDAEQWAAKGRGEAVTAMSEALRDFLAEESRAGRVAGVIGLGGSGGTAIVSTALRALPIGLPKLIVSTMASGNTAPYVDCSDIMMLYSVVDVAGLNAVSRQVLGNAAHAMAGMVNHPLPPAEPRPTVGMTMFGVTTPCVTAVRQSLELQGWDCLVFHATGTGGRALEQLVESGFIQAVLDLTTTEVADEIAGGVFPAGQERFERTLRAGVPFLLSLGALDMVNFGARATVPARYQDRLLHVHNAQVTLMRTNVDENRQCARWIANKLNQAAHPWTLLVPLGGVSALDLPGQAFYDPAADAALFETLEQELVLNEQRRLVRLPHAINDPQFATAAVDEFQRLCARTPSR